MPTGKFLTEEQRWEIYEARMLGEDRKEIAEAYGIKPETVTYVVRRQEKLIEGGTMHECVVAGDKKNGRLVSTGNQHHYIGTCIVGGKSHSKVFTTVNAKAATKLWKEWCDGLRLDQKLDAVLADVEQAEPSVAKVEPVVPEPVAPKPVVPEPVEPPAAKAKATLDGREIFVIWSKGANPRLYKAFTDMELALKEVERANEIASFLTTETKFEIENVTLTA